MNNLFVSPISVNFTLLSAAFHLFIVYYQLYLNLFKSVISKLKNNLNIFISALKKTNIHSENIFIISSPTELYLSKINSEQNSDIFRLKNHYTNKFDMIKMSYINRIIKYLRDANVEISDFSNNTHINDIFRQHTKNFLFQWNIAKEYALYNINNSNITMWKNIDQNIKDSLQNNPKYICSKSGQIMQEPTYILDENNNRIYYERLVLEELLSFSNIHPITHKQISKDDIVVDFDLMNEIANKKILPVTSINRPNNPAIDAVTIIDNPELTFDAPDEIYSQNPELTLQFNNTANSPFNEILLFPPHRQIHRANTAPPKI